MLTKKDFIVLAKYLKMFFNDLDNKEYLNELMVRDKELLKQDILNEIMSFCKNNNSRFDYERFKTAVGVKYD
jgi:hypothetical protein